MAICKRIIMESNSDGSNAAFPAIVVKNKGIRVSYNLKLGKSSSSTTNDFGETWVNFNFYPRTKFTEEQKVEGYPAHKWGQITLSILTIHTKLWQPFLIINL